MNAATEKKRLTGALAAPAEQRAEWARQTAETINATPGMREDMKRRERVTKATRYLGPTLVLSDVEVGNVIIVPAAELETLKIDESYQRSEVKGHVSKLIAVLEAGGQIPDPITVAVRPDGGRFIVDGQQRWWAHWNCQRPIRAQLIRVPDIQTERTLFSVMNARVALSASARVKTWPGAGAELVRQLDTDSISALRGRVLWGGGTSTGGHRNENGEPYHNLCLAASTLAQAVLLALSGNKPSSARPEDLLPKLDRLVEQNQVKANLAGRYYAKAWTAISDTGLQSMPRGHSLALALAFHRRWTGKYPPELSKADVARLSRLKWDNFAQNGRFAMVEYLAEQLSKRWQNRESGVS